MAATRRSKPQLPFTLERRGLAALVPGGRVVLVTVLATDDFARRQGYGRDELITMMQSLPPVCGSTSSGLLG
jgi:hypothetical protein